MPNVIKAPTLAASSGTGTEWSGLGSPGNTALSDDSYCVTTLGSLGTAKNLDCSAFGFAISSSSIDGIQISAEGKADTAAAIQMTLSLSKDGSTMLTPDAPTAVPTLTATDATYSFGSATEQWGSSWTDSDINSSSLTARVVLVNSGETEPIISSIDYVTITVWYKDSSGGSKSQSIARGLDPGSYVRNHQAKGDNTGGRF